MKRFGAGLLLMGAVLLALSIFNAGVARAGDEPHKVFVCKYVGTPGVDERLQTGDNPIDVDVNSIPSWPVAIGSYFADAQGRSYVLAFDVGQPEPSASDCPGGPPPSTTTSSSSTSTTTTTTPTTDTQCVECETTTTSTSTTTTSTPETTTTSTPETSTTPPEETTTSTTSSPPPPGGSPLRPSGTPELPFTGSSSRALAALGTVILALGLAATRSSRKIR
ncbi:MAG TPA: hypothetical protein VLE97_08025 [Gaiellaceae bacterium]|nr:hypothetical protein [Gaiellaceae bacterium]